MRINKKVILISLLLLFSIFLLSVLAIGSILSAPHKLNIGTLPGELTGYQIKFKSNNANILSGWFVPGKDTHGGILLMHGVRSNRKEMLQRAIFLNRSGYSVLLFDFQAHGESEGKHITFGYLEAQDAEAAYNYLLNHINNKSIGVIGVSLGGASALLSNVAKKANAIIIEAVYPTFTEAVQNRITMRMGKIGHYLAPLLIWQIKPRLGFDPEILRPIDHLADLKTPLFIISGSNDQHTTLSQSKRMYNIASQPKEFWLVKGAQHQNLHQYASQMYKEKVLLFFKKYL